MFRRIATIVLAALALPAFAAIEVNQASQAQLESVKGVGPALSSKILDARKAGEFRSWADLQERVSGVGPGSAARLSKAGLTVAGAAYTAPQKAERKSDAKPEEKPARKATPKADQKADARAAAKPAGEPAQTAALKTVAGNGARQAQAPAGK